MLKKLIEIEKIFTQIKSVFFSTSIRAVVRQSVRHHNHLKAIISIDLSDTLSDALKKMKKTRKHLLSIFWPLYPGLRSSPKGVNVKRLPRLTLETIRFYFFFVSNEEGSTLFVPGSGSSRTLKKRIVCARKNNSTIIESIILQRRASFFVKKNVVTDKIIPIIHIIFLRIPS